MSASRTDKEISIDEEDLTCPIYNTLFLKPVSLIIPNATTTNTVEEDAAKELIRRQQSYNRLGVPTGYLHDIQTQRFLDKYLTKYPDAKERQHVSVAAPVAEQKENNESAPAPTAATGTIPFFSNRPARQPETDEPEALPRPRQYPHV